MGQSNQIRGTIPNLSKMTAMEFLWLGNNRLEGTIPWDTIGTQVITLALGSNQLFGTISDRIANFTRLGQLYLHSNHLTGTLPIGLGTLKHLGELVLHQNGFTGSIPSFSNAAGLCTFTVSNNKLTGTVPWSDLMKSGRPSCQGSTTTISLANNQFTGVLPASLPPFVKTLLCHNNAFSGPLPSMANLTRLERVTFFNNQLRGRIVLPKTAANLRVALLHNNRLSCTVDSPPQVSLELHNSSLFAPGDQLTAPAPAWEPMASVSFMWSPATLWEEWQSSVITAAVGYAVLLMLVALRASVTFSTWLCGVKQQSHDDSFFWFDTSAADPDAAAMEGLQLWAVKLLALSSVAALPVAIVQSLGAHFFECGRPSFNLSIANLGESPHLEWLAILACVFMGAATWALLALKMRLPSVDPPSDDRTQQQHKQLKTIALHGVMWLLWSIIVAFFSVPSVLYVASTVTQPGDNVYGLSSTVLHLAQKGIGPVLVFINSILLPALARKLSAALLGAAGGVDPSTPQGSRREDDGQQVAASSLPQPSHETTAELCSGDYTELESGSGGAMPRSASSNACNLIMLAEISTALLVPIVSTMLLNQDCAALWIRAWQPCTHSNRFALTST